MLLEGEGSVIWLPLPTSRHPTPQPKHYKRKRLRGGGGIGGKGGKGGREGIRMKSDTDGRGR